MKIKRIICIVISLILLQLGRIMFKNLMLIFIDKTLLSDVIMSTTYMSLVISVSIIIIKRKKTNINLFPESFNMRYKLLTAFVLLLLIITPVITKNYEIFNIISLIYNAIITVVFEELIFRGFIFKEISLMKNDLIAYIISTLLFGIWHLGYIDTVIWRISLFSQNPNIVSIMLWKVITGLIIGILLGFFRYKSKNVYSSMLVHTFINILGS